MFAVEQDGKHKVSIHRRLYTTKRYQELYSSTANDVCFARRAAVLHFLPFYPALISGAQQKVTRKIHSANFATRASAAERAVNQFLKETSPKDV